MAREVSSHEEVDVAFDPIFLRKILHENVRAVQPEFRLKVRDRCGFFLFVHHPFRGRLLAVRGAGDDFLKHLAPHEGVRALVGTGIAVVEEEEKDENCEGKKD